MATSINTLASNFTQLHWSCKNYLFVGKLGKWFSKIRLGHRRPQRFAIWLPRDLLVTIAQWRLVLFIDTISLPLVFFRLIASTIKPLFKQASLWNYQVAVIWRFANYLRYKSFIQKQCKNLLWNFDNSLTNRSWTLNKVLLRISKIQSFFLPRHRGGVPLHLPFSQVRRRDPDTRRKPGSQKYSTAAPELKLVPTR